MRTDASTVGGGAATVELDPVTRYARAVVDGAIVAGRAVRLACQRHLRDLERQGTDEFRYVFDVARAREIIDFFPMFLSLENGDPFTLCGWQEFCLGSIFGWQRQEGDKRYRRFQVAYIETAKGSGKSPMLAGVGLYGLAFDGEHAAQIYSAAFDQDQASIIVNDAIRMAQDSPDLSEMLAIGKYNIAHEPSHSFMRAVSSEHRSKSGQRPSIVLVDEVHEHRDGTVITKMQAGFKSRKQPLLLEITNSGHDRTSICWDHHQKSLDVLDGRVPDESWFAFLCHLDACEKCYGQGYRQPNPSCEACDDWTDPAVWPKANPALHDANLPGYGYLESQVNTALTIDSQRSLIQRLCFCIWTETQQLWMSPDKWDACQRESVSADNPTVRPCAIGIDPSSTLDLTAAVVAIRHDDPPGSGRDESVEIEGMGEDGQRIRQAFTLNFSVEVVPYFWLPEATLNERVRSERIPYDVWKREGHLFVTPGPAIDHHAIYDFVTTQLVPKFKPQRVGMDEHHGRMLFMKLRDEGRLGDKVVSVGQAKKLSEAYKLLEVLIAHRRLWHNGHPVLAWNVSNAAPQRDRLGALWMEKPSETKRIDGVVAMAMAVHQLMALPASRPAPQVFFLGGRR